jgi:hypothetical protein
MLSIAADANTTLAAGGDSGAVAVDESNRVAGLIPFISGNHALAHPIDAVLDAFNVDLCTHGDAFEDRSYYRWMEALQIPFDVSFPPPRPHSPETADMLRGITINEIAGLIHDPLARERLQREALELVVRRAQQSMETLGPQPPSEREGSDGHC